MDFTNQCHLLIYFHNNKKRSFNWKIIFNNRCSLEKSEKINFQYTPFFFFSDYMDLCIKSQNLSGPFRQDHLFANLQDLRKKFRINEKELLETAAERYALAFYWIQVPPFVEQNITYGLPTC